MTEPNPKTEQTAIVVEPPTTQDVEPHYLHDKRYEEPFENDGAYADDDID